MQLDLKLSLRPQMADNSTIEGGMYIERSTQRRSLQHSFTKLTYINSVKFTHRYFNWYLMIKIEGALIYAGSRHLHL